LVGCKQTGCLELPLLDVQEFTKDFGCYQWSKRLHEYLAARILYQMLMMACSAGTPRHTDILKLPVFVAEHTA
jgi:hypothetical protein